MLETAFIVLVLLSVAYQLLDAVLGRLQEGYVRPEHYGIEETFEIDRDVKAFSSDAIPHGGGRAFVVPYYDDESDEEAEPDNQPAKESIPHGGGRAFRVPDYDGESDEEVEPTDNAKGNNAPHGGGRAFRVPDYEEGDDSDEDEGSDDRTESDEIPHGGGAAFVVPDDNEESDGEEETTDPAANDRVPHGGGAAFVVPDYEDESDDETESGDIDADRGSMQEPEVDAPSNDQLSHRGDAAFIVPDLEEESDEDSEPTPATSPIDPISNLHLDLTFPLQTPPTGPLHLRYSPSDISDPTHPHPQPLPQHQDPRMLGRSSWRRKLATLLLGSDVSGVVLSADGVRE